MKIKVKICPNCKSTKIILVAGGQIGLFECVNCRFRSAIFPEKVFPEKELDTKSNKNGRRT